MSEIARLVAFWAAPSLPGTFWSSCPYVSPPAPPPTTRRTPLPLEHMDGKVEPLPGARVQHLVQNGELCLQRVRPGAGSRWVFLEK